MASISDFVLIMHGMHCLYYIGAGVSQTWDRDDAAAELIPPLLSRQRAADTL